MLAGGSIPGDKRPLDDAEKWGVTLAGLGIVLAALFLLVIIIFLFGKLFDRLNTVNQEKAKQAAAEKAPKAKPAPSTSGFPRPAATPSSGFTRPTAAPSAPTGFQRPTAAPSAAPKQAPSNPINSAFTSGNSEKLGNSESTGFLRPSSNSAVTFPSPAATPAAATRTEPISSAFKSVGAPASGNSNAFKSNQPAPAPKAESEKPCFSAAVSEPSVDDLFNDLEKEIESYGSSDGPVVPPGIFAPPPKPGQ
jgi:Na+-transporting methylmalonyl-CoA/oxaloacetate decarboxylase gamma subunit